MLIIVRIGLVRLNMLLTFGQIHKREVQHGTLGLKKNEKGEVVIGVESVDYFQLIVV